MMPSPKNPSFATRCRSCLSWLTNVEEVGIQHDFDADGGRHHDAVPQSKAKEFCLVGDTHGGGSRRDCEVLHTDHLANHTAGGVGSSHERWFKSQPARGHHLQVAEERV